MSEEKQVINFDEVPEQQERPIFKSVKKGAKVLTITNIEEGISANNTGFLDVTFNSEVDDADFKHKFYTSTGALPKLMDLYKGFTGVKPTGTMNFTEISANLIGQSSNCIVDANIVSKQIGDKVYNNEYATFLRFRDFANKTTPYNDADARTEDKSAPKVAVEDLVSSLGANSEDDLPF